MRNQPLLNAHVQLLKKYGLSDHQSDCRYQTYRIGETILEQGAKLSYLMIVVSGKAKVCSTAMNGKDLVLSYYLSSGLIGDVELMTDSPSAVASVIALSEVGCIKVPYYGKQDPLFENLIFMKILAESLTEKLNSSSQNYLSTALYTGEQRLCSYILRGAYKHYFIDNLTDAAATIGLSYRHLFRLLKKLCDDQLIVREGPGFRILDEKRLRQRSSEASGG
ncbi:catabolite gene activator protein [Enterococcus florum]|uniref:Catabolite gene activator protein n=1 Tax=Enterococcus florum TaxID=2480627 RepID=A0A4P5PSQ2_9ENTE|nr:cyclic nucleotide-binding domain-containing protein [Enterococcus florum]GCF95633.1 catabolite gene activator protein [Enterococcus florum]